jgi:hypothetical protein
MNVIHNDIRSLCNTHSDQLRIAKLYISVTLLLDSHVMPSPCSGYTSAHWGENYEALAYFTLKQLSCISLFLE